MAVASFLLLVAILVPAIQAVDFCKERGTYIAGPKGPIRVPSIDACQHRCRVDSDCVAYSFEGSSCWTRSSAGISRVIHNARIPAIKRKTSGFKRGAHSRCPDLAAASTTTTTTTRAPATTSQAMHRAPLKGQVHEETACINQKMQLQCPSGLKIQIISAMYGRLSDKICPISSGKMKDLNCQTPNALFRVQAACSGQRSCSINVKKNLYGDNCEPGHITEKYLQVSYECVGDPRPYFFESACEDETLRLLCPTGHKLKILYATYGRQTVEICSESKNMNMGWEKLQCRATKSLEEVKNACDGRKVCRVKADNELFGDSCKGIKKYLLVSFQCVDPLKADKGECSKQNVASGGGCRKPEDYNPYCTSWQCWKNVNAKWVARKEKVNCSMYGSCGLHST